MGQIRWLALFVALSSVVSAWGETPGLEDMSMHDAPLVDVKIRELMQDGQYAGAIEAIDAVRQANAPAGDYLTYLRGRAFYLNKQYEQAVAAFQQVQQQFPQSLWCRRAEFAQALAHARAGQFQQAEAIYRRQAEYLLSADRKQQIAQIYLDFADGYFHPPQKPNAQPDYEKALTFYTRALEVGPQAPEQQRVALQVARCHQELGRPDEAVKLYREFIQDYPDSPLDVEARFRLGEVQLAQGQHQEARRTWQDLLAKHTDSSSERVAEAQYRLSRTWQIPTPQDDTQLSLGVAALETFWKRFPAHELAAEAHLDAARSYMHRGRYEEAAAQLKLLLEDSRYQERPQIATARHLLGSCYQLQKQFPEALATWRDYLAKHPAHEAWSNVQAEIVNTEFYMAVEARTAKEIATARQLFSQFVAKYPLDPRNPQILFGYGEMNYEQQKWQEALDDWRQVVSKYPGSDFASSGQFMVASTLEHKLNKLPEALEEYKKLNWGPMQDAARQAIERLTTKSLSLVTERIFRSNEVPKLKLTTRNIDTVNVRAYKVDMETYFRKMHLARGLEQLDIALIDPDVSFEFKIPDYVEYQQTESTVEVPLPAGSTAGVMAVTISSKTLEATTMVIQSDLDIIVKSSRDEVFVFAENMLTGAAWPAAKLLVSNGAQVVGEATTGDDGVFQKSYKELRDANDVRVFAVHEGHVASNLVSLQGVGVAQGLSDRGYLYSDRPAYRAGDMVHVRGCLRQAVDDRYVVPAGKEYKLQAFDPRNRLLREEEVVLGEYGSFHAHFVLPRSCPQGDYRFVVTDEQDHQYQGTFVVHEYKLEPVRLIVDSPRHVYYRGETIEGTIRAEFYHGAPLPNRQVTYQLAGDRAYTATTNEKGEIAFQLPTREFLESQVLPLVVSLPERALQQTVNFFLSTQGFAISLETVRPVYVAGESFDLTLHVKDAEGKPIAQKLTLRVLERTQVNGKLGERLVGEHAVVTDDQGVARQTLTLAKGGEYVCRALGTDRFANVVSGEHVLKISDDTDRVRLRILSDRHTYKVGETANVQIHWREQPALALVTYQGARVLDYQLITLQPGANPLQIPLDVQLAPNFDLAVALMTDVRPPAGTPPDQQPIQRFHETSNSFVVARELNVDVSCKPAVADRTSVQPGDEVEVTVKTTDPQGNPVAAEVSLALLEKSLLDRFQWPVPPIDEFFAGAPRQPMIRTTSSITFAYEPGTRPIDRQLLAETQRLEVAEEEAASRGTELFAERAGRAETDDMGRPLVLAADGASGGALNQPLAPAVQTWSAPESTNGAAVDRFGTLAPQAAPAPADGRQVAQQVAGSDVDANGVVKYYGWMAIEKRSLDEQASNRGDLGAARFYYAPANADNLLQLGKQNRHNVVVLQSNGVLQGVNLWDTGHFDAARVQELANRLADSGAVLVPDVGQQDTAYWNPAIVTDQNGQATVRFTVPERSTAWSFAAKGITVDTLAGEASSDLAVKKELFGELKLPLAFTDGDQADVLVTVHNSVLDKGQVQVTLKSTIAGRSLTDTRTIEVTAQGLHEVSFPCELRRPSSEELQGAVAPHVDVEFELTVSASGQGDAAGKSWSDIVRQTVPLQPYGMPVYATASGFASSDITAWVEAPKDMPLANPGLEIVVGPTVQRSLVDIVLAPALPCQIEANRIASVVESTTSDLLASIGLQELLAASRHAGGPTLQAIDQRIRAAISALVASQNDDGGWSWSGQAGTSDRYASARVVWALALARKAAYRVADDTFDKAVTYLDSQIAATDANDYESKAILLHALTMAGREDFTLANRIYRSRPVLSPAALAYTALTFAHMGRTSTAKELLDAFAEKDLNQPADRRSTPTGCLPWSSSPAELRALYALGLELVEPAAQRTRETVDWLMAHRTGHRWLPDKATGPAGLALSRWSAESQFEGEDYRLTVLVNDQPAGVVDVTPASLTQTIAVPRELLQDGKQRIQFQITGRGRYTYQCILGGFVPADQLKTTVPLCEVQRFYEPGPLQRNGKEIPRGFDLLTGSFSTFRNPLTQLPVAQRGQVELYIWRHNIPDNTPESQLEYLVINEPIPCGATVVADSVQGAFERFEIAPGAITFYVGNRRHIGSIRYDLVGYLPGRYRVGPTVVRNAYRPEQLMVTAPVPLEVLPLGTASKDEYKLTPRELFELGKLEYQANELDAAQSHLEQLIGPWNLRPEIYQEAVTTLFNIHLAKGPAEKIVQYFEIVREKWPNESIPFEKILKVGEAYDAIGEYERSYLVFRATVEGSFSRESSVAGFLESQGEFLRSVHVMGKLLSEYPPESYIASADYSLAQRVYAKAPTAAEDPKIREQKVNRIDLTKRAWRMLESFLTAHPDDPAADQAAFAAANALLDVEAYDQAAQACQRYAERYPKSELLDSFWYIVGYCRFAMGDHQQALDMCRKVAEAKRVDERTGRELESDDKWRAVYILGQIHHSLGQAAEAIAEYRRVEDRFPDAKQSIEYFTRKEIQLPEVATIEPGKPVQVALKYRNLAACDLKVYRIDLMKFGLLKRDLQGITQINLAGIRPFFEQTIELGDGQDYRDRSRDLDLPLDKEGAYLVVCRGEDLYTSGLVLVTPLVIEVQEDAVSGQVRTTVKTRSDDRYLHNAHVKAIGSRNDEFVSGQTDLRGVYVADGILGASTVIAQTDPSRYAFFRGNTELVPQAAAASQEGAQATAGKPAEALKRQLLEGLQLKNSANQMRQVEQLNEMYEAAPAAGVEASKALQ